MEHEDMKTIHMHPKTVDERVDERDDMWEIEGSIGLFISLVLAVCFSLIGIGYALAKLGV